MKLSSIAVLLLVGGAAVAAAHREGPNPSEQLVREEAVEDVLGSPIVPSSRRLMILPPPILPLAAAAALAHAGKGKGAKMVPTETTEMVEVTEYQDKIVTKQEIVNKPTITTESVLVKTPKVVMVSDTITRPKVTYQQQTVFENKPVVKPVFTMEPEVVNKPNWVVTATMGKGKGFVPKISADVTNSQKVVMKPRFSTVVENVQLQKTVSVPVTTMETVVVNRPQVVMEDTVVQRPKVTMEQQIVEKQVTVKEPVTVQKPVKKIVYVPAPCPPPAPIVVTKGKGKGASLPSISGLPSLPSASGLLSSISGLLSGGSRQGSAFLPSAGDSSDVGTTLLPSSSSVTSDDDFTTGTVVTSLSAGSAVSSSSGSSAGVGTVIGPTTVITGPDGRVIDPSTLKAGDVLPPGSTIRSAPGGAAVTTGGGAAGAAGSTATAAGTGSTAAGAGGAGAGTVSAAGSDDGSDYGSNGGAAMITTSTAAGGGGSGGSVTLVTNPDGSISAVPGGSQGGSGSRTSWSGGNATSYVSGLGPYPTAGGSKNMVINGFGFTNSGFPIVGNTPVAFLPPERAALYPSANTTISWPCGDKATGTEIIKGIPCGVDLVAVPTSALPADVLYQLKKNFGAGSPSPDPSTSAGLESGRLRAAQLQQVMLAGARTVIAPVPPAKEAALEQTMDQRLVSFMQKGK